MIHKMDVRVYYEDTDAGGVMYHGTHLNYAERARTELLREMGYQNSDLAEKFGMIFLVRHLDIDYLKPAFLDDFLSVKTAVLSMKNTSFTLSQKIFRENELIADMNVALVCVDANTIKPLKMPEALKADFKHYLVE